MRASAFQGVDFAYVKEPCSEQDSPNWASFCFVMIKDQTVVAAFARYWS